MLSENGSKFKKPQTYRSLPSRNATGSYPWSSILFGNKDFTSAVVLLLGNSSAGGSSKGARGGTYITKKLNIHFTRQMFNKVSYLEVAIT